MFTGEEDMQAAHLKARGWSVAAKAGLNRGILDNTPGTRARQLDYKCAKLGSVHVRVPAPNTSRRCSRCKAVDPAKRPGCGRIFACVACGHQDHADHNAAVNIREAASNGVRSVTVHRCRMPEMSMAVTRP